MWWCLFGFFATPTALAGRFPPAGPIIRAAVACFQADRQAPRPRRRARRLRPRARVPSRPLANPWPARRGGRRRPLPCAGRGRSGRSPRDSTCPTFRMPPAALGNRTPATSRFARRSVQGRVACPISSSAASQPSRASTVIWRRGYLAPLKSPSRPAATVIKPSALSLHGRASPAPARNPGQLSGSQTHRARSCFLFGDIAKPRPSYRLAYRHNLCHIPPVYWLRRLAREHAAFWGH